MSVLSRFSPLSSLGTRLWFQGFSSPPPHPPYLGISDCISISPWRRRSSNKLDQVNSSLCSRSEFSMGEDYMLLPVAAKLDATGGNRATVLLVVPVHVLSLVPSDHRGAADRVFTVGTAYHFTSCLRSTSILGVSSEVLCSVQIRMNLSTLLRI